MPFTPYPENLKEVQCENKNVTSKQSLTTHTIGGKQLSISCAQAFPPAVTGIAVSVRMRVALCFLFKRSSL